MLTRICFSLALIVAIPVWSQAIPIEEDQMLTPPTVSGEAYPTSIGSEMRSNYLGVRLIINTAYNDNVLGGDSTTPIRDFTYSILPTVTLDKTTPRQHLALTYSPGFTFFQHTSALNAADQTAALNFQYRLSEHTTILLSDSFQKSSSVFNQAYSLYGGTISGSAQSPPTGVIVPYADQLNNAANAVFSYQFARNGMIGVGGIATENKYPNTIEASGLYNSNSLGGSTFYSQRLSSTQYIGVTYQYLSSQGSPVNTQANPVNAQTGVQTHTLLPFYTIYLNPTLSLSLSCGPQYFHAAQSALPSFRSWTPSATASIGWQKSRTNFVVGYSRTITGGVGLPGAFDVSSVNASARWQFARTWIAGFGASYSINKNVTPFFASSSPGGHTVAGIVSVQHSIGERFKAELGYAHLHQSYSGISVISAVPDSNREYISVSYQFTRPLGR